MSGAGARQLHGLVGMGRDVRIFALILREACEGAQLFAGRSRGRIQTPLIKAKSREHEAKISPY